MVFYIAERSPEKRRGMAAGLNGKGKSGMRGEKRIALCYSSILLAGLFASQTLIAYPIVSKLGIARDKAVTIAVGGTVTTDTLALLLLTVIVGMVTGNTDELPALQIPGPSLGQT